MAKRWHIRGLSIASGYVSTDGVAQIANIVGLKFASEAAKLLRPKCHRRDFAQLLRNSITEIRWTANKTSRGIEDKS